jgi:hypothetical protein
VRKMVKKTAMSLVNLRGMARMMVRRKGNLTEIQKVSWKLMCLVLMGRNLEKMKGNWTDYWKGTKKEKNLVSLKDWMKENSRESWKESPMGMGSLKDYYLENWRVTMRDWMKAS